MNFKKYLLVFAFFIFGIVVGRNMPGIDSRSNTAAITQTQLNPVSPLPDSKTTTTTNTGSQLYVPPTYNPNIITPGTPTPTPPPTNPNPTYPSQPVSNQTYTTPTPNSSTPSLSIIYSGYNLITSNVARGNASNDVNQVMNLQRFLIKGNFLTGTADGKFGPMTQQAVIKFQSANKISPAVGYVGTLTRTLINDIISNRAKPKDCPCTNISGSPGIWSGSTGEACQAQDCGYTPS